MQERTRRLRQYYDTNSRWMMRFGQGRGEAAIHRPVYLQRGGSRRQALHTVDRLVAEALQPGRYRETGAGHLLDLGCGVGGSAIWLTDNYPVAVTGVTLSPVQLRSAEKLSELRDRSRRCRFLLADFTSLPPFKGITGAYAIESFSHGHDARAFFSGVFDLLPAGGRLVLCDDFLTTAPDSPPQGRERWVRRLREGWRLDSLMSGEQVVRTAAGEGFRLIRKRNLTPYLRPLPRSLSLLQLLLGTAAKRSAWGSSLYGGSALQICQRHGWSEYLFLVLEKR